MSQPEHEAIVNQIRSAQIAASPELRARVRAIAARRRRRPPSRRGAASCRGGGRSWCWRPPPSRSRSPRRSPSGSSTPAVSSEKERSGRRPSPRRRSRSPGRRPTPSCRRALEKGGDKAAGGGASTGTGSAGNLPATPGRAQLYDAELTLKIKDLSTATKKALRLTRDFHGYVRSVDYGSGTERGSAYLVLRVPGRERPGGDRQVLGARPDPRPARLDPGRPADGGQAVPPDAGAARPDHEAAGEAPGPVADRRASAPRSRTSSLRPSTRCSASRSRRPRWPGRRATRRSSSTCARARRQSSLPTSRAGSAAPSIAPARSWSTRSRCSSTCSSSARRSSCSAGSSSAGTASGARRDEQRLLATRS